MADFSLVTEIVIDAGPSVAGADQAVSQLDRITAASARAVENVDRLSAALGRSTSGSSGEQAAAQATQVEAALSRQSGTANATASTMAQLEAAYARVGAQQSALNALITRGGASSAQTAELATLTEQYRQLFTAMVALNDGMKVADAAQAFPKAFAAITAGATAATEAQTRLNAAMKAANDIRINEIVGDVYEKAALDASALATATNRVRDQIDPLGAAFSRYREQVAALNEMINTLNPATKQAFLSQEEYNKAVAQAAQVHQEAALKYDATVQAAQRAAAAAAKEQSELAAAGAKVRQEFDAQAVAVERYNERLQLLQRLGSTINTKTGQPFISSSQEMAAQERAAEQLSVAINRSAATTREFGGEADKATEKTRIFRGGIMELQASAVNTFQALAAGMNPMFVAQMEGAQVVGGLVQSNLVSWRALIALGVPLAGFAAIVGLIASRAMETEHQVRLFSVGAETMGTQALASGQDLHTMYEHLRDTGVGGTEALKVINQLRLSEVINPAAIPKIADLATRLSALKTGGLADTAKEADSLQKSIEGGTESVVKFGISVGALDERTAPAVLRLGLMEGSGKAVQAVIEAMDAKLKPAHDSMSKFAVGTAELSEKWNKLRDAMAQSEFGGAAVQALGKIAGAVLVLVNGIDDLLKRHETLRTALPGILAGAGGGAAIGAAGGAVIGAFGGPIGIAAGTGIGAIGGAIGGTIGALTRPVPVTPLNPPVTAPGVATYGFGGETVPLSDAVVADAAAARQRLIAAVVQTESGGTQGAISPKGAMGLMQLMPGTAAELGVNPNNASENILGGAAYLGQLTQRFGSIEAGLAAYNAGPGRYQQFLSGTRDLPDETKKYVQNVLARAPGLSGDLTAAQLGLPTTIAQARDLGVPQIVGTNPASLATGAVEIEKQNIASANQVRILGQVGAAQEIERVRIEATTHANLNYNNEQQRQQYIDDAVANKKRELSTASLANSRAAQEEVVWTVQTAEAYNKSQVAGIQAAATQKALLEHRRDTISVDVAYREELIRGGATAQLSATQQIASTGEVLSRQQQLADAALKGTRALSDQRIAMQAAADTQHVFDQANALLTAGFTAEGQGLLDVANKLEQTRAAQLRLNETQQETIALGPMLEQQRNHLQLIAVESATVGQTTEQQRLQLSLLQAKQQFMERFPQLAKLDTDEARQQYALYMGQATAIATGTAAVELQREAQQRLNDAVRSVASTIESQIGTALDNAFSGQKAIDWGETMKTILRDLMKQIVEFMLIKPAIGSALSTLGFAQVAQQFGTFGGLGGGGIDPVSGLSNATTSGSSGGLLGSGGSGGILGTLGNAIGGISKLGSLFGGGGGGGLGSLFGIGGAATDVGASIAGTGGLTSQALLDFAPTIGTATETATALGAAGVESAVSAAGSGIIGTIGSALPYIGVAIAAATLLKGFLGNKKPSTFSSGDLLDLSTGTASGFSSSGNAQNDATVHSMTTAIAQFTKNIGNLTGGTAPTGSLNLVATTKGIEAHYSGELGKIDAKFANAQEAINGIELAITQNLKNVSGTLQTVLSHITDPSQIQAAVTFAKTYDDLSKAAAGAFSSISTDTGAIGQFTTALQNIQKTFSDITTQANQFGLALDPINAGLAQATKRLQTDFAASLDEAANGGSFKAIATAAQTFQTNTRDAISIGLGGDQMTLDKIARVEQVQAAAAMAGLTSTQLQAVADKFQTTNPEIAAMARALLGMGDAARTAATSTGDLTSGLKSISDLVTSLRTGQLSGLTPAAQATTSAAAFHAALAAAQAGASPQSLANLSTAANDAFKASQAAYGEGPQTAALRNNIIFALDTVLNAPAGSQSTTLNTAAVRSAQAAAAALAGANTKSLVPGFALGTQNTPPGAILVGEAGPELIFQQGGATIVPISQHAAYQWRGPSYAGGTGDVPAMLAALLAETAALRRQVQAGQVNDDNNARQMIGHTADVSRKVGAGIRTPTRQRLA